MLISKIWKFLFFIDFLMQFLWSVYILMGYWWAITKLFISERVLIVAQILNWLCRALSVVCQQISSVIAHLKKNWKSYVNLGWSWLCWYGSWIFNYLCYQCLSPLKLWVQILRCTRCNFLWWSLSLTCGRLVVFPWYWYSGFLHQ